MPEIPDDLGPTEFKKMFFDRFELMGLVWMWTHLAQTGGEYKPVGFTLAWSRGRIIEICDMVWFPWATPRNVFESTVHFFNLTRKSAPDPNEPDKGFVVLEYARPDDKKFFERIARLGILKRVGHVHGIYPGEPAILFQTSIKGV